MTTLLRRLPRSWSWTRGFLTPEAQAHRYLQCRVFLLQGPWRPATFVSLLQNKSQLLPGIFSFTIARIYFMERNLVAQAQPLSSEPSTSLSAATWPMTVEAVMLVLRALYLLVIFTPLLVFSVAAKSPRGKLRALWLRLLVATISSAGPAFMKWGQWAATRPDIFSSDICKALCKLQNNAPSHSFEKTKQIVEDAFQCPMDEIFTSFKEEPTASGSIAQVHEATLRHLPGVHSEQVVAVKVRHPSACKEMHRDFRIINWLARWSTSIPALKHLQLDKCAHQLATAMAQQLDLSLEAVKLFRFIYNFRNAKGVSFPEPKYPFVHPAVLVETFEEGKSIREYIVDGPRSPLHSRLAEIGAKTLLKMLLVDNFIHGDLHPGNVFVKFSRSSPNLVFLDVGMTAEICGKNRLTMLELFKGVAERDGAKVAECTLAFSDNQTCPDPEGFKRAVDVKFKKFFSNNANPNAQSTGQCMMELFEEIRKHQVDLDGDVCSVMVTTLVLEGWQRKLDPNFDMLNTLGTVLKLVERMESLEYVILGIAAP